MCFLADAMRNKQRGLRCIPAKNISPEPNQACSSHCEFTENAEPKTNKKTKNTTKINKNKNHL